MDVSPNKDEKHDVGGYKFTDESEGRLVNDNSVMQRVDEPDLVMNVKELNAKLKQKKDSLPNIAKKRNTSKTMITSKPDTPKKGDAILVSP